MDDIKGWKIDLKALYGRHWRNRKSFHLSEDLQESPDGDLGVLIYGIAEVGISKEAGHLALFRGKDAPRLVAKLPNFTFWHLYHDAVQFGADGFVFVHRLVERRTAAEMSFGSAVLALNTRTSRYALVDDLPEDFYQIRHIEGTQYGFGKMGEPDAPECIIDLAVLSWKRLGEPLRLVVNAVAWSIPTLVTAAFGIIFYRLTEIPVVGTLDWVLPDGPLADETNFAQVWHALSVPTPLFAGYAAWLWRMAKRDALTAERAYGLFGWALMLLCLSPPVFMALNSLLDRAETVVQTATLLDKYESTDPNTATNPVWRLTVSSWRPGRKVEILSVAKVTFDAARPGDDAIVLRLKPGYFGYPWIESQTIAPAER